MLRTQKIKSQHPTEKTVKALSELLLRADPNIVDVIQFGSSVYAPELARDIDLVITTTSRKDHGTYLDAVDERETEVDVDIIVREPGEPIGDRIALGLMTTSEVIYGDGETLKEAERTMAVPTFDEVRKRFLTVADQPLDTAHNAPDADSRDQWYRLAYDALFDIARNTVMAHLNTEQTRWGRLR